MNQWSELTDTKHGKMLVNKNDEYVGRALLEYGEFSEGEIDVLNLFLKPGDLVIECGSNIGAHTVWLSQRVYPGTVYAFEPQRSVFQLLCANLALNNVVNVHALQTIAGKEITTYPVPLLDPNQGNNFGGLELKHEEYAKMLHDDIACMPLDLMNMNPALIKADVEGMERDVLEGAVKTILTHRPVLYLEADRADKRDALLQMVAGLGYRIAAHHPPMFNESNFKKNEKNVWKEGLVSINVLCVPSESEEHNTTLEVLIDSGIVQNLSKTADKEE